MGAKFERSFTLSNLFDERLAFLPVIASRIELSLISDSCNQTDRRWGGLTRCQGKGGLPPVLSGRENA